MPEPPTPAKKSPLAVIFDLDGTLIDSLQDIASAANATLVDLGFSPHPVHAYRSFIGRGVPSLFQQALPAQNSADPDLIAACAAAFSARYSEAWHTTTVPYPGIANLLDLLTIGSVPLAILSNKPDPFTRACVDRWLGSWPFVAVVGDRPGHPRKPNPSSALALASAMATDPRDCLFVGDSAIDMATALAAGMRPIGVAWGFSTPEFLMSAGAVRVLRQSDELLQLIDSRS